MSAEWQVQSAESWKITLPCSRAQAEALIEDVPALAAFDPPPTVMTSEPDPAAPDAWLIDVYVEGVPTPELIEAIGSLAPDRGPPEIVRIEDEDWVTRSQAFLVPIRAGRFHVFTGAHAGESPAGTIPFLIEAGRAFGTGHHETTTGCLEMLDQLATAGHRFANIADIGTGTGLLAFAARALWPEAPILAADIDPIAIDVTRANMAENAIPADAIALFTCPGVDHPEIARTGPFDLLIANILAGPLIELAPSFADRIGPGGRVMLAGLLADQEDAVVAAFAARGFRLSERLQRGDWPTLVLVQRP
ncbi:50S ribosomal protein L11 methyltransferase [Sphingomonas sp. BIUV-7]|uniref:Ribosomal protein L11 methyltransferase n=1 Tax=Sphingomonas natans TaxID=3063330 RepID=A0ABT8Y5E2_9SPHN|nr:50S ribosomal protein L11 methyltransferase [Sphingomonas sp. BIUV-7]MDO6413128.1 50S ribosomal protein L11 methyltransferase [Sphingomonas sp. BIUV-7]